MSIQRIVSRADLYNDKNYEGISTFFGEEHGSEEEYPHEELEIIDVVRDDEDDKNEEIQDEEEEGQKQEEEFEFFPLFANEELTKITIEANERISDVMEAEIEKEEEEDVYPFEYVKQERPENYYFSRYTTEEKSQFQEVAVDLDILQKYSYRRTLYGKKDHTVLDLIKHNAQIEAEELRCKKLKRRRLGKKQRLQHKMGKQHEQERVDLKQNLKKRFRKRGGKKNKKPKLNPLANAGADLKD
ncbi:hypothetical protein MOUN0_I04544 [Monosporozyma unispora]|nr:hypothetical protein C6P44_004033 [Kazachstania unispora]